MEIPLSLYIHFPFCLKKCPYCDFHSRAENHIPQKEYFLNLKKDFEESLKKLGNRRFNTVFIGGGTPSLIHPFLLEEFFSFIFPHLNENAEITLEANPGALELGEVKTWKNIGINRISLGVQSFQNEKLKSLGRIHSAQEAQKALTEIGKYFENFNIDLILSLPNQNLKDVVFEIETALKFNPAHISAYHLTLEPHTQFFNFPPQNLPDENLSFQIGETAEKILTENAFQHYEISAYAKENYQCRHNLNYWQFGDYLGIGSGAHSKLTIENKIYRESRVLNIKDYLNGNFIFERKEVENKILEFLMNAFRLEKGFSFETFENKTGIKINTIQEKLKEAEHKNLITVENEMIQTTEWGKRFLNPLLLIFA